MTIELSEETKQSLQAYLAAKGLADDAMSDIVNEAVETFLFRHMFREAHEHNAGVDVDEAEVSIEDAIREYRDKQISR